MPSFLRGSQGQIPEAAVDRPSQDLTGRIPSPDFDLEVTLGSGQVFRWRSPISPSLAGQARGGPVFTGWIGPDLVQVRQENSDLLFCGTSPKTLTHFFSLDIDLKVLAHQFDGDPILHEAVLRYWGLRVIRQEPWECLCAFILSSFNNIPRLTGMLERLAARFGEPVNRKNKTPAPTFQFPRPEALADGSERVLRRLGLGFRAPYLKAAAQRVASGQADLERWRNLEDEALRRALLTIPGVGEKVVECVLLFGYARAAAFPVDVWIGRVMRAWYFRRRKVTDRKIREFARKRFGPHCGWAQQYLYHHARSLSLGKGKEAL